MGELAGALEVAAGHGWAIRVAGGGQSCAALVPTSGLLVYTDRLDQLIDLVDEPGSVDVEAGCTLRSLHRRLAAWGRALEGAGEVDGHTIAGALATGIHGSGARFPGLASQVLGLDLVGVDGGVLRCSPAEEPEVFAAACVGLGALGVVARVTLRTVPAFNVRARDSVEPLAEVLERLEEEIAGSDHFECTWLPPTALAVVRRRQRTDEPPGGRGHLAWAAHQVTTSAALRAQAGVGRRWPLAAPAAARLMGGTARRGDTHSTHSTYTDRSYRVIAAPRRVRVVETEWALPRTALRPALAALVSWHEGVPEQQGRPALRLPVDVRTAAADDVWLSGAQGRDTGYITARFYPGEEDDPGFGAVAAIMGPLGGRPQWGTLHPLGAADLAPRYGRWDQWQAVRRRLDPDGRFANPETNRVLGPAG